MLTFEVKRALNSNSLQQILCKSYKVTATAAVAKHQRCNKITYVLLIGGEKGAVVDLEEGTVGSLLVPAHRTLSHRRIGNLHKVHSYVLRDILDYN